MIAVFGVLIANYVIRSLALYKIAQKRQVCNPIFAWIPIADCYLIGSLAQEIDYRKTGHERKWGKAMLILAAIGRCSLIAVYVVYFISVFMMAIGELQYSNGYAAGAFVIGLIITIVLIYAIIIVSVLVAVSSC